MAIARRSSRRRQGYAGRRRSSEDWRYLVDSFKEAQIEFGFSLDLIQTAFS